MPTARESLLAGEQDQKEKQRNRQTDAPIDLHEGDRVIVEGLPARIARVAYADEDSFCCWPDCWPADRKQWGPLGYEKDSPLVVWP